MKKIRIATIIGARPQFVKAATVSRILKSKEEITETIIHTGQHYDQNMSDVFFKELDIPEPNYNLEIGSGSHGLQTGTMLIKIEELLLQEKPDIVLIYGDTNSTIAGALAAAKIHIPVAHVEAGLRSHNRKMPEEINRITSDHLSDLLFAPTETAVKHLTSEGLKKKTYLVGDVMYDSLNYYRKIIDRDPDKYKFNSPDTYYLATIHRPVNSDNKEKLQSIFNAFSRFNHQVVFPAHPRVRKMIGNHNITVPQNVKIMEPVGYLAMISLLTHCKKIFTDSGGMQKEAYILGKPCVTLREETEWVETLYDNWNVLVGADEGKIHAAEQCELFSQEPKNFYGDGTAAVKIANHMVSFLAKAKDTD